LAQKSSPAYEEPKETCPVNEVVKEVLGRIDASREEIAELALQLGNTFGPVGHELATAQVVHEWALTNGLPSQLQEIIEDRANAVQRIPGSGDGPSILFNAHLDTEASGPDFDNLMGAPDPNKIGAWRDGDRLFGHVIQNDRGCITIMLIAGRALLDSHAPLRGDVILTSVAGETGQSPVDEYQGLRYEGKGLGSSFLVDHGIRADYALVAETSGFVPCWHACGAAYYKVTLRGRNMYTPRLQRGTQLAEHPNAIVKAASVIQAIEEWAIASEEARSGPTPCGEVRPKSQIGAVRGGIPWRPNRSAPYCALYVDVRTLPGEDVSDLTRSLRVAIDDVGVGAELELIMSKPGAIAIGVEPLVKAVNDVHRIVRGTPAPSQAETAVVSMWRDTNVFNAAGIPSLTFGPSRGKADVQGTGHFELDDLVDGAKMYALTALRIAGDLSAEDL
jgi:acetylornithine deacetylase/succinyl-diaminopimelate desuccinylase-like protein